MSLRAISKIVNSRLKVEGTGAKIHRSLGIYQQRRFNPFLMFDHFLSAGNAGFPAHPHQGHETITYVLQGAVAHEDFTGARGILYPGDLQFMTAGRGIMHAEMPVTKEDGLPTIALQLWVDLPENERGMEPRYRDLREWEIPEVEEDGGKVRVKVISGKSYGVESIKELAYIPMDYFHYKVKAGGEFKQELRPDFNYFLYVIRGNGLELNGDAKIEATQNAYFEEDGDYITGKNTSQDEEAEFAIIGGQRLDQEAHVFGTFVADSDEHVKQGLLDYKNSRNGFERVKTWKSTIDGGVTQEVIDGPLQGSLQVRDAQKKAYLESLHREHIAV
ncbi:Pirin [Candida viswanathii]|uniref:Pirin n=1 Tax=Candida viswanathii TaxID=5486 RepID=A0A367XRE5_9ASCO|nr:Pirin [Candida viswanathii]